MAQIRVTDLTFTYEGSADPVLENVSFHVDTDWKLGLIGRNGKGKTTLLSLLMGKYEYSGTILTDTRFDYFPYTVTESELTQTATDLMEKWKPHIEMWQVNCTQVWLFFNIVWKIELKTLRFSMISRVLRVGLTGHGGQIIV